MFFRLYAESSTTRTRSGASDTMASLAHSGGARAAHRFSPGPLGREGPARRAAAARVKRVDEAGFR